MIQFEGNLDKMQTKLIGKQAFYSLVLNNNKEIVQDLNGYVGNNTKITIEFNNIINCVHCNRVIKKTFNQGYCFPCFRSLARCDSCIISPENCHYHLGTCREPKWGESHCMQDHIVYLANSSDIKVGLTRLNQIPTRWIDQGAAQALIIARVSSRYQAGLLEVICKQFLSDKTNWRTMLKNDINNRELYKERDELYNKIVECLCDLQSRFNNNQIVWQQNEKIVEICYPVHNYPSKVHSFNLDKTNIVQGILQGIKGQYLILDTGVINLRKYTGYLVKVTLE